MSQFDPYLNWLGIPLHEQPPNFYRLLGIVLFESSPQIIEQAADRQSLAVGAYQAGPHGELCQRLLSEIAMARFNLLEPQQKAAYDAQLQQTLAYRGERAVAAPPPPTIGGTAAPQFPPAGMPPPYVPPVPSVIPMPAMRPFVVPVAAPFPVAARAAAGGGGASPPVAPPAIPPAAPLRPMDELERLAAQPAMRRRVAKKKRKTDYGKEIMVGGFVAAAGALLIVVYLAGMGNRGTGLNGISDDGGGASHAPLSPRPPVEKPKSEKKSPAAAEPHSGGAPPNRGAGVAPVPAAAPLRNPPASSDQGEFRIRIPPAGAGPAPRNDIDSPRDLEGPDDPVMGPEDAPKKDER